MISNRFAAQFYPEFEFDATSVEVMFGEDVFGAQSTQVVAYGWTNVETQAPDMTIDDEEQVHHEAPAEFECPTEEEQPS